jgi:hypothetical protein
LIDDLGIFFLKKTSLRRNKEKEKIKQNDELNFIFVLLRHLVLRQQLLLHLSSKNAHNQNEHDQDPNVRYFVECSILQNSARQLWHAAALRLDWRLQAEDHNNNKKEQSKKMEIATDASIKAMGEIGPNEKNAPVH